MGIGAVSNGVMGWLLRLSFCTMLITSMACSDPRLPQVKGPRAEQVQFAGLVTAPENFRGTLVRVSGWCRIEFEGNALYPTRAAWESRDSNRAVWLQLGWPVSPEIRALDGARVVVEGRFIPDDHGHLAAFAGSLEEIQRIEAERETGSTLDRTPSQADARQLCMHVAWNPLGVNAKRRAIERLQLSRMSASLDHAAGGSWNWSAGHP